MKKEDQEKTQEPEWLRLARERNFACAPPNEKTVHKAVIEARMKELKKNLPGMFCHPLIITVFIMGLISVVGLLLDK